MAVRNLKTFVRYGRRYRVVYTTNTEENAQSKASNVYGKPHTRTAVVFYDNKTRRWLVGVLPRAGRM